MGLSGKIPQNEKAHSGLLLGAFIRASGEMADAQASGACIRKDVGVQVPPRPPIMLQNFWDKRTLRVGHLFEVDSFCSD